MDKWFVKRNTDHLSKSRPYGVFQKGFRDSSHYNKYEAEERCFELNFLEEMDFWNKGEEERQKLLNLIKDDLS